MPWRDTRDPYAIWLSEVMLQQTQVDTVRPYYDRFLNRWPTVAELAAARIDDVMKMWEGLGYYARCRNMHRAAQQIVDQHHGVFPAEFSDVLALPGVGRSTAGAILTFSYGQRHPIMDGNVKRVLTRLYDEAGEVSRAATQKRLWESSGQLLGDAEDAWTHNQAMMELGAVICTPRTPECPACPVQMHCSAFAAETVGDRPVKKRRKPLPHKHIGVGVVYRGPHEVLIQLRPANGLLGGLWEFPGGKQEPDEPIEETVRRELAEELAIEVTVRQLLCTVRHTYSHFKVTLHVYTCDLVSGTPTPRAAQRWLWSPVSELSSYAFPKANRDVLAVLGA